MFDMDKADRECEEMLHGEEKPLHPDTVHLTFEKPIKAVSKKETTTIPKEEKPAQKVSSKPREAYHEPVPCEPTQMEKIKECAKSALCFGGLSLLFFYWQQTGQMGMLPSMICISTCCVLLGLGVGKNAR